MMQFLQQHLLAIVVTLFIVFAVAEMAVPMRPDRGPLGLRWFTNVALLLLLLLIYKLLGPLLATLSALLAEHLGIGLLNRVEPGLPLALLLGILLFDFKQYWFHRLMHYPDWLWRIHRVHHSDIDIDLTTGFRFHPFEAILSLLCDLVLIAVFGIPAAAVMLRYLLIYFANFFTHGNIRVPAGLDRALLRLVVTPSMHHLHHAMDKRAANSNFGVLFSFWDRLFGTYLERAPRSAAGEGGDSYAYGLREYRDPARLDLLFLALMPFKSDPVNRESRAEDSAGGSNQAP